MLCFNVNRRQKFTFLEGNLLFIENNILTGKKSTNYKVEVPVISRSRLIIFLLYFISASIYIYLGILVIRKNYRSLKNRLIFLISISLTIWAISHGLSLVAFNGDDVLLWRRIGALGYLSFYSLLLHFTLVLTEKKETLKKWWVLPSLYFPAIVLISVYSISSYMQNYYELTELNIGWVISEEITAWSYAFYLYFIAFIIACILLLWKWGRNEEAVRKKKQSRIILSTLIIAFTIGTIADILPLYLDMRDYPDLAIILITIPISGIFYSVEKYKLMSLSPKNIAGDILETMNDGLIVIDKNKKIQMVNQRALEQLNYKKEDLINKTIENILKDDGLIESFYSGNNSHDMIKYQEKNLRKKDGKVLPVLFSIALLQDDWGDELGLIFTFSNIEERVEAEKKLRKLNEELEEKVAQRTKELEYLANHDSLTRLPNRRLFIDRLNREIVQAEANNQSIMVVMLDLDGFKEVNDTLGHEKGDELLKMTARRLRANLREQDIVARFGGDEFIIKCKDIKGKKSAKVVAEKIIETFQEPFEVGGRNFEITASVGAAFYPEDGQDVEKLTKKADQAMYVSKKFSKNQYTFYGNVN